MSHEGGGGGYLIGTVFNTFSTLEKKMGLLGGRPFSEGGVYCNGKFMVLNNLRH